MFTQMINKVVQLIEKDETIMLESPGESDFFIDPASDFTIMNAPIYAMEIEHDFTISCRITPEFTGTYDAGALMLYIDDFHWIKFAFEQTDLGYTSAVSVVTDEVSDDSNGEKIDQASLWLKVTRKNNVFGYYHSLDGKAWKMVRLFRYTIDAGSRVLMGLESQSPIGNGCRVLFEDILFKSQAVSDLRKGE